MASKPSNGICPYDSGHGELEALTKPPKNNGLVHDQLIDLANPVTGSWESSENIWDILSQYDSKILKDNIMKVSTVE